MLDSSITSPHQLVDMLDSSITSPHQLVDMLDSSITSPHQLVDMLDSSITSPHQLVDMLDSSITSPHQLVDMLDSSITSPHQLVDMLDSSITSPHQLVDMLDSSTSPHQLQHRRTWQGIINNCSWLIERMKVCHHKMYSRENNFSVLIIQTWSMATWDEKVPYLQSTLAARVQLVPLQHGLDTQRPSAARLEPDPQSQSSSSSTKLLPHRLSASTKHPSRNVTAHIIISLCIIKCIHMQVKLNSV